ncbi:hypothetical protein PsAD46_03792 [Pseudovibrio sp. Ad46]|uniref:hypothetical protein n=1 Tax=unclassified Pseudovibrio TaxID=2627060 RepID=UPI0007B256A5|nr:MULTISPECIES: hypothetical protein [unclassified Pseudovibrio]KZK80751.1 hypothetical protein PsAD46_03792 [Pseudovibrio sp. Ad46]KZK96578.1 hypothetical protein PsAD5_02778 [Pseudovibrio sp. Ad5]
MLRLGWGAALFCYVTLSIWLLRHTPSIPSDDAYFFVNGTVRFSVLEFRPHFPGYPGFIVLSKLLVLIGLSAKQAVFYLSLFSALSLPPFAAWTTQAWGASHRGVLLAFFAVLTQPFLPLVALSMMSDATGIAFFLAALAFMGRGKHIRAGCFAGFALACRPSFIVPVALALITEWYLKKEARTKLFIASASTLLLFFGGVFLLEGEAYLIEALRFTEGHFTVWGNTSFEQTFEREGWLDAFEKEPIALASLLSLLLIAALAFITRPKLTALLIAAAAAVLWTLLAQNPENLRHVLLPAILLVIWLVNSNLSPITLSLLAISLLQLGLWSQFLFQSPTLAPLQRVTNDLLLQPSGLLVTNHGVSFLQDHLKQHQVLDAYFIASTEAQISIAPTQPNWRLFSLNLKGEPPDIKGCYRTRILGDNVYCLLIAQAEYLKLNKNYIY